MSRVEPAPSRRAGVVTRDPKISVVIRAFNEEEFIGRLLESVFAQTVTPEVILVDSGSTDRTVEIATEFPIKLVQIRPQDFSFGRALNIGCEAATTPILAFVSAHCYPAREDWLQQMLEPFADPEVGLVYGKQRGNERTKFSEHRIFEQWFPDASEANQAHPFCNNANCAVRRNLWRDNPYDEALTGLEDLAWAKWAIGQGHRIAYQADAEMVHVHEETPRRIHNRYYREALAFKLIFPEEVFGFRDLLRLMTQSMIGDMRVARRDGAFLAEALDIIIFRAMQYTGTYRGFRHHGKLASDLKRRLYYPNPPSTGGSDEPSTSVSVGGATP